jgi:anthranilate 1,2-dioxygenase small subunit
MPNAKIETMKQPIARERLRELRWAVEEFNYEYADVLDRGEIERWPDFFTEDGVYRLIARDNADAGLPLSLMSCEGKGMLKDRAYAIAHTEMFAPRYTMHHIGHIRIVAVDDYLVTAPTRLLQSGKYYDTFLIQNDALLLKERRCIYDTVLVPTCIVYPP